ncbi:ABC-2 type transport system permease protein [Enterococcus rotai]|uniref:Uncharacterized protein n=1 Tax=Enterococcus rotai TaxID=118060 RepID=A0A0U2WUG9_9ENTE|nr:hypothetical protein [Enterococcus rotai]ALS35658.1 hypothetical protein ATZ35_00330 [Enterococcus rotai]
MLSLLEVEIFKLNKKGITLFIIIFNCLSLVYALGLKFNWSFISITGTFDLIKFVGAMWQLLLMIGIPTALLTFIGASLIGTEIAEGQIVLEITRVADVSKLLTAKFISLAIMIVFYFLSNISLSSLFYLLLVKDTKYATNRLIIFDNDAKEMIITCIAGMLFVILLVFISMAVSVNKSAIFSMVISLLVMIFFTFLSHIEAIAKWLPGYLSLSKEVSINIITVLYHIFLFGVLFCGLIYFAIKRFRMKDF